MALDAGSTENPMVNAGSQVSTPVATMGFGAREQADETRQAAQTLSNDMPVDVNPNAVVCRSQVLSVDVLGKNFINHTAMVDALQARFLAGVK